MIFATNLYAASSLDYLNKAIALSKEGKNNEAIENYAKSIEQGELDKSDLFQAYYNRAMGYSEMRDYDSAIKDYTSAIKLKPEDTEAYNSRGVAYKDKGEYDKAIIDFDKVIELDPNNALAYFNRGNIYDKKEEYDNAIADYNKAIKLNPDAANYYSNRGLAYDNNGEYDKAIADFNKAIELEPKKARHYYNRGLSYDNKGENDKAIQDYSKAIELDPKDSLYVFIRGFSCAYMGEYDRAIKDYDRAIEMDPHIQISYLTAALEAMHYNNCNANVISFYNSNKGLFQNYAPLAGSAVMALSDSKNWAETNKLLSGWDKMRGMQMWLASNYIISLLHLYPERHAYTAECCRQILQNYEHDHTAWYINLVMLKQYLKGLDFDSFKTMMSRYKEYAERDHTKNEFAPNDMKYHQIFDAFRKLLDSTDKNNADALCKEIFHLTGDGYNNEYEPIIRSIYKDKGMKYKRSILPSSLMKTATSFEVPSIIKWAGIYILLKALLALFK